MTGLAALVVFGVVNQPRKSNVRSGHKAVAKRSLSDRLVDVPVFRDTINDSPFPGNGVDTLNALGRERVIASGEGFFVWPDWMRASPNLFCIFKDRFKRERTSLYERKTRSYFDYPSRTATDISAIYPRVNVGLAISDEPCRPESWKEISEYPSSFGPYDSVGIQGSRISRLLSGNSAFLGKTELLRVPVIGQFLFPGFFKAFYRLFKVAAALGGFREFQLFGSNVGLFVRNPSLPIVYVGLPMQSSPLQDGQHSQNASEDSSQDRVEYGPPIGRRFILVWSSGLLLILGCYFGGKLINGGRQVSAKLLIGARLLLFWFGLFLICVGGFRWSWGWWL